MNCKEGDLAYYIGNLREFHFRIVKCINPHIDRYDSIGWEVYPPLPYAFDTGGMLVTGRFIKDSALRPIRDSDKEDEMLRLIGKPETNKLKV